MTGAGKSEREALEAIERELAELKTRPPPEKDERFWTDFSRNVRVEYAARKEKKRGRIWVFAPIGAAAAVLVALLVVSKGHDDPRGAEAAKEMAFDAEGVSDERDLDDVLDSLNPDQLAKVAAELGVEVEEKKGG